MRKNAFHFKLPMPLDRRAHTSFNLKSLVMFEPSALIDYLWCKWDKLLMGV